MGSAGAIPTSTGPLGLDAKSALLFVTGNPLVMIAAIDDPKSPKLYVETMAFLASMEQLAELCNDLL